MPAPINRRIIATGGYVRGPRNPATSHQSGQPMPKLSSPMVNTDGTLSAPWYRLLITLWQRTGGVTGDTDSGGIADDAPSDGQYYGRNNGSWTPVVGTWNGRTGDVALVLSDITAAGGAPLASPVFTGTPEAPTAAPGDNSTTVATTEFVTEAIAAGGGGSAGVSSWNGRTGAVTLTLADVTAVGGAPIASPALTGTPTAPTPTTGDNSTKLATTAFVANAVASGTAGVASFNGRTGIVTLTLADVTGVGGAPAASPALTGTPTAPTAAGGTNTTQVATTAFVASAISAIPAGVSSFNTRTGAVTLALADVTGVGGAPTASPTFTGTPAGPTASPGTNTTQLATTAFVTAAVAGLNVGVTTFNTRSGAVTLTLADVTGAGGAPLASPAFTGTPTAPTIGVGDSSTKLATTQFVTSAIAAIPSGVTTWNGRSGAVVLTLTDVTNVGGAPLASPAFTGTPAGPTAVAGTNTTQLATTAFVTTAVGNAPYLPLAGGTLTGPLILAADPTVALGTATKQYVDAHSGGGGSNAPDTIGPTFNAVWNASNAYPGTTPQALGIAIGGNLTIVGMSYYCGTPGSASNTAFDLWTAPTGTALSSGTKLTSATLPVGTNATANTIYNASFSSRVIPSGNYVGVIGTGAASTGVVGTVTLQTSMYAPKLPPVVNDIGIVASSTAATLVLNYANPIPAGATIIVCVAEAGTTSGDTTNSCVDNVSSSGYTAAFGRVQGSGTGLGQMFYKPNFVGSAGSLSITYTRTASSTRAAISAFYVTGLTTATDPLDTAVTTSMSNTGTGNSLVSGTPSVAGELFVGLFSFAGGNTTTYTQDTTNGWAAPPDSTGATAAPKVAGGTKINAAASTVTFNPGITLSAAFSQIIYGFKPA